MNIETWWPKVTADSREWLLDHAGEPVEPSVRADILSVTAVADGSTWDGSGSEEGEFELTDRTVDWIEAVANGETPIF
ncbi:MULTISPECIES: hypothetical protein [unclassified Rhodococcus (in: high G+C Gram-positive bacteria)]|uniref:hypothetical protein n=1 Tax=unclassified Rhodococcus (in: high G+C Gram-positive bacteria) TaxID=192944 RepID=UPI0033927127